MTQVSKWKIIEWIKCFVEWMKRNNKIERLSSPMNVPGEREDNPQEFNCQNGWLFKKGGLWNERTEKEDCSVHQMHQMREIWWNCGKV